MRSPTWLLVAATALATGCAEDDGSAAAAAAFGSFQEALQRGDAAACRDLLTLESRPVVDELPWHELERKQPLVILGVEPTSSDYRIRVADPNDGDRTSEFVVVREYGRFVVDLVATAGMHTRIVEAAGFHEQYEQRELTPADLDRIRKHELSQPPR